MVHCFDKSPANLPVTQKLYYTAHVAAYCLAALKLLLLFFARYQRRVSNIIDDVLEWSPKLALQGMMKQQSDVANVTDFLNESSSAGGGPNSEEIPLPPGDIDANMEFDQPEDEFDQPEDETSKDVRDNSRQAQQTRADL
uniref:Uncharacterized protein n=2 Tax=Opuntia streptacantha TaxID=393608 RepID=A0A7C9CZA6_OPUST